MPLNKQLANTQDLVAVQEIRDGAVVLKDGRMVKVLMVSGMNTALKSEAELDIISTAYRSFLNGLDFQVQIIIHSRKVNIRKYLEGLETRKREEPSSLLQSQISEYQEFVSGFVKENDIMEKVFLVVAPFKSSRLPGKEVASGIGGLIPFFKKSSAIKGGENGKEIKKDAAEEASFREDLEQLNQRVGQVVEGLRAIELQAAVLSDRELVELFYNFYNPEAVEREEIKLPGEEIQKI